MRKLLLTIALLAVGSQVYADVCNQTDATFKDYVFWKTTKDTIGYTKTATHSFGSIMYKRVLVEKEFWATIPKGSLFLGQATAGPDGKIHSFYCEWGESNIYLPIKNLERVKPVY